MNLLLQSQTVTSPQRQALWLGFGSFCAAVAFLGFVSIIYDFHDCFYPARTHPYFTSGRLMLGALIPFLLLFVHGLGPRIQFREKPLAAMAGAGGPDLVHAAFGDCHRLAGVLRANTTGFTCDLEPHAARRTFCVRSNARCDLLRTPDWMAQHNLRIG